MNQKILGIIPLMVALLFVAAIAVGDNPATAANPENQVVTVTVPQAISIAVETPVTFGDVSAGTTGTLTYWVANVGNVKIDLSARANQTSFQSTTATDVIDINGNYFIQQHGGGNLQVSTTNVLIYNNMNKASQGSGIATNWTNAGQSLNVPSFTEDGTYSIGMIYSAVKHN